MQIPSNLKINRDNLLQYLKQQINHNDNPQIFEKQLEDEVDQRISKYQDSTAKEFQQKIRVQKKFEENQRQREILKKKIDQKLSLVEKNRKALINDKITKHKKAREFRQNYVHETAKVKKTQSYQYSLKKIKEWNQEQVFITDRLKNSQSQSNIKRHFSQKLKKRQEMEEQNYEEMLSKLQSKKIFQASKKNELQKLYHHRIKKFQESQDNLQKSMVEKIGASLSKIDQARKKKEMLLAQKADKIKKGQNFYAEMKKVKKDELKKMELIKIKDLKKKEIQKFNYLKSLEEEKELKKQNQRFNTYVSNNQDSFVRYHQNNDEFNLKNQSKSYKPELKKHIEAYLKKQRQINSKKVIKI